MLTGFCCPVRACETCQVLHVIYWKPDMSARAEITRVIADRARICYLLLNTFAPFCLFQRFDH